MEAYIDLPLHGGRAPKWLYSRMRRLGYAIIRAIELEYGPFEVIKRFSDPLWFQALSCVLGYDWHSSGTTTVTIAAIRDALKGSKSRIRIAGGKAMARKTPLMIEALGKELKLTGEEVGALKLYSRYAAKADTIGLLDGFSLYHHSIVFDASGAWTVVQQGMREEWARRYHILGTEDISFEEEPHTGIISARKVKDAVDLLAKRSREAREAVVEAVREAPKVLLSFKGQLTLDLKPVKGFKMPKQHFFSREVYERLLKLKKEKIKEFKDFYNTGVGAKTMRALVLISEVIFDVRAARKDPVKYSFAHGGKDGVPFPVNRKVYDRSIKILEEAIEKAELGRREKLEMLKKLSGKV